MLHQSRGIITFDKNRIPSSILHEVLHELFRLLGNLIRVIDREHHAILGYITVVLAIFSYIMTNLLSRVTFICLEIHKWI